MKVLITTDWYAPIINGVVPSVLLLQRELEKLEDELEAELHKRLLAIPQIIDPSVVAALRYLMKPVAEDNLFPLLDLVLSRLGRASRYLAVEADGEHLRLEEDAILYLEARGHAVRIETEGGPVTVKEPLSALACRLGTDFVPAHRSFLVNLRRVERVGRTACLLEGGRSVPVSRGAWERLSRAFIDYYREA